MNRPVSTLLCSSQRASLFALPSVRCFHSYAESYAETYAARIAQIGVNSPIVDIDVLFECSPVVDYRCLILSASFQTMSAMVLAPAMPPLRSLDPDLHSVLAPILNRSDDESHFKSTAVLIA
jgi:hypothetical protein